jgi:3-hydroxyisobutyrate dehydrogenase-like beta-hydroxyacid dehydrogenase
MPDKPRIGFAGLGIMGSRMARRYLDAGYPLTVWNRTGSRGGPLVEAGAGRAADPADLARAADALCINVADPAAMRACIDAMLPGLRRGQVLIDFSTVDPASARAAARLVGDRGVDYVEAPVTGSKNGAAQGTLLVMAGGDEKLVERARPLLQVVAKQVIHCGPTGAASLVKLVGNGLIAHMLVGLAQGLAVAREAGVDPARALEVVQASGFSSPYYSFKGQQMLAADWETHFSLDLLHKDLLLLVESAAPLRVPLPGVAAMLEVVQAARARGLGAQDIAAVAKLFEVAPR